MSIDQSGLTFIIGIIAVVSIIINVYKSISKPQVDQDKMTVKLQDDIIHLKKEIFDIKETHLRAVESDVKSLTKAVNDLSITVVKLATIIDERIPKASPTLTPIGS